MIRTLILYYLSIKSTHGYEIQRFIQLNHMDEWTKIQSGSIYYALGKLEKEGAIEVIEEVGRGKKARKVYKITKGGQDKLEKDIETELGQRIGVVGSDKFIIYPLLNVLDKKVIKRHVEEHIDELNEQLNYLKKWAAIKINDQTLKVEKISMEMMIQNVSYQILWHEALIEELDDCVDQSKTMIKLIKGFDFSNSGDNSYHNEVKLILSK